MDLPIVQITHRLFLIQQQTPCKYKKRLLKRHEKDYPQMTTWQERYSMTHTSSKSRLSAIELVGTNGGTSEAELID